jgi:arylsulfatase A-like enzyme
MDRKNLILLTMDEVRADHLSCYGYRKIRTENIDSIARDGVLFETCISSSELTPICHASLLSGRNPYSHGLRSPFDRFDVHSLPLIMKEQGYRTAGFVGNSMLGANVGFDRGFDVFDEPKEGDEFMWELHSYNDPEHPDTRFPWGNWWIDRMVDFINRNMNENFFLFGHFFHTHEGSEKQLIKMGLIDANSPNSNYGFYDDKIRLFDEMFLGPIIKSLKENRLYDDTILVITADHGTTLGERPLPPIPWRKDVYYPQHTTMYEPDIRIPCIIKDKSLPKNKRISECIKQIDILPTLLNLLELDIPHEVEGCDLINIIEGEKIPDFKAYIEDLFLLRGPGALQAVRSERYKYIVNQTTGEEEFYDIIIDPNEEDNRIKNLTSEEKEFVECSRVKTDSIYADYCQVQPVVHEEKERVKIMERLRILGYII